MYHFCLAILCVISSSEPAYSDEFDFIEDNTSWITIEPAPGIDVFQEPKLVVPPVADDVEVPDVINTVVPQDDYHDDAPEITYYPQTLLIDFSFFGTPQQISIARNLAAPLSGTIGSEFITAYWERMDESSYTLFINQLVEISNDIGLNDWGYFTLLDHVAGMLLNGRNDKPLFMWYMLVKSDIDARIGFTDKTIYLLLPFEQAVYNIPYFTIDRVKYFAINVTEFEETITSYRAEVSNSLGNINLSMNRIPSFGDDTITSICEYAYDDNTYHLPFTLNSNIIDFYSSYPQTEPQIYVSTPIDRRVSDTFDTWLSVLDGMSEQESVQFLLDFVQTAFPYEIDENQFGKDKYMFVEESLFYQNYDCDDRAIFFAYLIRTYLNLDVIGITYPNHMATAVKLHTRIDRDYSYIIYEEDEYIICDPTYINGSIGESIPMFDDVVPTVVPL